jgi:hypothetical protein
MNMALLLAGVLATTLLPEAASSTLWFVTSDPANDVLALTQQALPAAAVRRATHLDQALTGDAVLVLADGYPWRFAAAPPALLSAAREKKLRLYLEYLGDLPGFNRSDAVAPAGGACLQRGRGGGGAVVVNVSTTMREFCACLGPGAAPSTMQYTGALCGAAKDRIVFHSMVNLDPCADTKGHSCAWNATNESAAWQTQCMGSCGVAPSDVSTLPTHLCSTAPAPPPAPPAPPPPSLVTKTSWKLRAVVTTDQAAEVGLPRDTIMLPQGSYTNAWCAATTGCAADAAMPPGCVEACNTTILALAKVAGVYTAPYGADKSITTPLLFEHNLGGGAPPALIATTKLTSITSGRFGPASAWHALWVFLLQKLGVPPATAAALPHWQPVVGPAYDRTAVLPTSSAASAVRASAMWLVTGSKLLSDTSDAKNGATTCCVPDKLGQSSNECVYRPCDNDEVCPMGLNRSLPSGVKNKTCIQEGWSSILHWNGTQHRMATFVRTDGNAETSMGLACAGALLKGGDVVEQKRWVETASAMADYMYRWSDSQTVGDVADPAHGIIWWNQEHPGPYAHWASVDYGDNAGNVLIGGAATRSLAQTGSWDEQLLRCLLAEARTSGKMLYRPGAIAATEVRARGWEYYWNSSVVPRGQPGGSQPHYGSYLPAAFLSLGAVTGLQKLLIDRATAYCTAMMAGYLAGEWEWNESMSNEQARFLLPLAWLVRVDDTPLHRSWLDRLVTDLLASQDPASGAIKQEFGKGNESGRCGPCAPATNAEYGSGEGPIMHDGTEPLSDALYTLSFAAAGLREAYGATGLQRYADAETKLVEFLVR